MSLRPTLRFIDPAPGAVTGPWCCKPWDDEPSTRRDSWEWQVVHQYAHSRVPFTIERFEVIADIDPEQAEQIIGGAVHRDWIQPVDGHGLYVGRLESETVMGQTIRGPGRDTLTSLDAVLDEDTLFGDCADGWRRLYQPQARLAEALQITRPVLSGRISRLCGHGLARRVGQCVDFDRTAIAELAGGNLEEHTLRHHTRRSGYSPGTVHRARRPEASGDRPSPTDRQSGGAGLAG